MGNLQKIKAQDLLSFREKWKISIDNTRKNKNDTVYYMLCQYKDCKVKYKTKIPFQPAVDEMINIEMKNEHHHDLKELEQIPCHGLQQEIKDLIFPLVANKVKPKKIEKVLQEYEKQGKFTSEKMPSLSQIKDYKRNYNRKMFALETESQLTGALEEFIFINSVKEDAPFIIGQNLSSDDFCLVFSSKTLLRNVLIQASRCRVKFVCFDGTYKLTALGFPVLVVGTQDINHKFHLIVMAISKHERESDYQFVLSSINYFLKELYDYNWEINLLIADGSLAIYNAGRSVFGQAYTHGMCAVHVWRNLEKKISSYVPQKHRKEIRYDLKLLEKIHDSKLFEVGLNLFQKKWETKVSDFYEYFITTWADSVFSNWYKGSIPPGFSNNNNTNEDSILPLKANTVTGKS